MKNLCKMYKIVVTAAVLIAALAVLSVSITAVYNGRVKFTPGDINGDGVVDNKDIVVLFRYVSGFSEKLCVRKLSGAVFSSIRRTR